MNSLITKIPNEISDSDMVRIGEISFAVSIGKDVAANDPTRIVAFVLENSGSARIVGNGNFLDADYTTSIGKEISLSSGYNAIRLSNGNYNLFVNCKYGVKTFQTANSTSNFEERLRPKKFDLTLSNVSEMYISTLVFDDDFEFSEKINLQNVEILRYVGAGNTSSFKIPTLDVSKLNGTKFKRLMANNLNLVGNLNALSDSTSILSFFAGNCGSYLKGSISSLAKNIGMTGISIDSAVRSEVSGTVEEFLNTMRSNGRVSGSIEMVFSGTSCTYNGSLVSSRLVATFTASGWTIA